MPRHIHLEPHLTNDDLEGRYRRTRDPVERSHWHFLWLLARGLTATAVARVTGYSAYWIGRIARRYNRDGPDGMRDRRHTAEAHPAYSFPRKSMLTCVRTSPSHIPLATAGADAPRLPGSASASGAACAARRAGAICGVWAPAGASPVHVISGPTRQPKPSS